MQSLGELPLSLPSSRALGLLCAGVVGRGGSRELELALTHPGPDSDTIASCLHRLPVLFTSFSVEGNVETVMHLGLPLAMP